MEVLNAAAQLYNYQLPNNVVEPKEPNTSLVTAVPANEQSGLNPDEESPTQTASENMKQKSDEFKAKRENSLAEHVADKELTEKQIRDDQRQDNYVRNLEAVRAMGYNVGSSPVGNNIDMFV